MELQVLCALLYCCLLPVSLLAGKTCIKMYFIYDKRMGLYANDVKMTV